MNTVAVSFGVLPAVTSIATNKYANFTLRSHLSEVSFFESGL